MPHPESEHSLKAQLACALKETEDVNALRAKQDAELVALRAEVKRLRDKLERIAKWNDEQLAMLESEKAEEFKDGDPTGYYACWINAHKIAAHDARAALAGGGGRG